MKKIIIFSMSFCMISMVAMEQKPLHSIDYNIALALQAIAQNDKTVRDKILKTFKQYGINLAVEKDQNPTKYTKMLQLGAIFLGASMGTPTFKNKRLKEVEKNTYYKPFFVQYPGLRDALIDLGQMYGYVEEKKGKKE